MAEKRKPLTVLWVREGSSRRSIKIELFPAREFQRLERFTDKQGAAVQAANVDHYFRLRVDGTWRPIGRRILFTKNQCALLIKKEIFRP